MSVIISQILVFCYFLSGFSTKETAAWHPLHLSSTDIVYTTKGGTLEISSRLFTDDLEDALRKQFNVAADLSSPARHQAMDELLRKYVAMHFKLQVNGKPLSLNYLGFEKDREAVLVYIESAPLKSPAKIQVFNTLMYDLFDDQTNLMHVSIEGKRKSSKLDYPKNSAVIYQP